MMIKRHHNIKPSQTEVTQAVEKKKLPCICKKIRLLTQSENKLGEILEMLKTSLKTLICYFNKAIFQVAQDSLRTRQ